MCCQVDAAPGDITLELMASPAGFATGPSLGHAFFCIGLDLNSGIKEECCGFYPKKPKGMFVGGPGAVNSEFQKSPARFSNVTASFKILISDAQRLAIYKLVNDFDAKDYSLTSSSCIDFLVAVAQAASLKTPTRSAIQFPKDFVEQLQRLN